jgi:HPt (histidine-containing phosphotransfer) domain-containing protein
LQCRRQHVAAIAVTTRGSGIDDCAIAQMHADGSSQLDVQVLLELFDGDRMVVIEILDAATESIRADAVRICTSVDAHDGKRLAAAAHHLKGTCGELRATRLGDVAALIERAPLEVAWTVEPALVGRLRCEVAAICVEIERVRGDASVTASGT